MPIFFCSDVFAQAAAQESNSTFQPDDPDRLSPGEPSTFSIRGMALDVNNKAIAGAKVILYHTKDRKLVVAAESKSQSDGTFHLSGNVRSKTGWMICASFEGKGVSIVDRLFVSGTPYDIGRIYLFDPIPITGIVKDTSGYAVPGARVRAWTSGVDYMNACVYHSNAESTTDRDGQFAIKPLPPGEYHIAVEK